MADRKITDCKISPMPGGFGDPLPKVQVRLGDDNEWTEVFDFFPDELSFSASEFLGLTLAEASERKREKDLAYLQS